MVDEPVGEAPTGDTLKKTTKTSFSKLFGTGVGWAYLNARYEGQFDGQDLQVGMELTGPVARINFTF